MRLVERLVYMRQKKILYPFVNIILLIFQVEIPKNVSIGSNLRLQHRGMGVVINPYTRIGQNVTIYPGVIIGSSTPWNDSLMVNYALKNGGGYCIDIQDDVTLCSGSKILCKDHITIAKGSIIAANAVLTCSTGENEIWGGIPAKCIGKVSKSING